MLSDLSKEDQLFILMNDVNDPEKEDFDALTKLIADEVDSNTKENKSRVEFCMIPSNYWNK